MDMVIYIWLSLLVVRVMEIFLVVEIELMVDIVCNFFE